MPTLKQALREWQEWDSAAHELALALGIMDSAASFQTDVKHVFWSRHPVGEKLQAFLESLAQLGVIEVDEVEWKIRWCPTYKGSWEKA